jgi:hypothetical protein
MLIGSSPSAPGIPLSLSALRLDVETNYSLMRLLCRASEDRTPEGTLVATSLSDVTNAI